MTWLQLQLPVQRDQVEQLEEHLIAAGAVAVTLQDAADQPVLEPAPGETPLWGSLHITGLFPADTDMDSVIAQLPAKFIAQQLPKIEILEDKDWEREWIQHYQPMSFGERLWVCPSWIDPPQSGAINLLLDPGLAFGTGTHPTTALCLGELDGMALDGKHIVDYGCGSGILAVAGLKLGASAALGVDNDPQALTASLDNARRNGIDTEQLRVVLPGAEEVDAWSRRADVVTANILAGPLIDLAPLLCGLLCPGGTLILSGLLQTQASEVSGHYLPDVHLETVAERDGWVCLRGTRVH